jgi:death on curing protein
MALAVILELNGWSLDAPEPEVVAMMLGVAAGDVDEARLATWVRAQIRPVEPAE